jgi:hypothetical protein
MINCNLVNKLEDLTKKVKIFYSLTKIVSGTIYICIVNNKPG